MKKTLLSIFAVFLMTLPVFSKAIDFQLDDPDIFITQNFGIPFVHDAKRDSVGFSTTGTLDFSQLRVEAGVQGTGGKADFSALAIYWPIFFEKWNIGPGVKYHFFHNSNSNTEHDLLLGLHIKYTGPILTFYTQGSFFTKISHIPVLTRNNTFLDQSIQVNIDFYWTVTEAIKVYFTFDSSSFYDYFLFCTPIFTTGGEYLFWDRVTIGSNIAVTFLDMFTVSSHYSQISVNTYFRIKLY